MTFTEADLDNLSTLARITITKDEKPQMLKDMQAILAYVSEINDVKGEIGRGEEVVFNITRPDVITNITGTKTEAILKNAPATQDGYVEVMQVLK